MFKALRNRVGILSSARPPLSVHSAIQRYGYPVERVRLKKPLRPRVIFRHIVAYSTIFSIFTIVVLVAAVQLADGLEEIPDEDADDDVKESSLFIPFPLTTKLVQPPPYRGSDPEWQGYINFSRNPALVQRVRTDLVGIVVGVANATPALTNRVGKGIKFNRFWLDMDFPMGPPPEFLRSGIEMKWNEDYSEVSWKAMPVDSSVVLTTRKVLWPSAVSQSLWSFFKVLFTQDTASVAGMLGLEKKPQPPFEPILAKHAKRSTKDGKIDPQLKETQSSSTTAKTPEENQSDLNNAAEKHSQKTFHGVTRTAQEKAGQEIVPDSFKEHTLTASTAFRTELQKTWKRTPSYEPRGSIMVSGLIELNSPKAWLVMYVRAAWDPKTKDFDPNSMHIELKRFQPKKQSPLGVN